MKVTSVPQYGGIQEHDRRILHVDIGQRESCHRHPPRAPLSRGKKGSLYALARRVVERGVLEKVHIAVLATPKAMAQHFLSHPLLPIQSTD